MAFEKPSFKKLALGALGISVCGALAAAILTVACDDPHLRSDGGTSTPTQEGGCSATPGTFPIANCDNSDHSCSTTPSQCTIDKATCGDPATCLPIGNNMGKTVQDFRLRRLNVIAPAPLAKQFIQAQVVTDNIDLNAKQCGEVGKGLFNWLLRVDRTANTLVTGGAPPTTDPFGQGFCFATFTTADNIPVAPITSPITFAGDTFQSTTKLKLNIPVFLTAEIASAIILPITDILLQNVTISADDNCIGTFNQEALDPGCFDDPSSCYKWNTNGALGGYITIKEADEVNITDLGESLCVLLTGTTKQPNTGKCPRDGQGNLPATARLLLGDQRTRNGGVRRFVLAGRNVRSERGKDLRQQRHRSRVQRRNGNDGCGLGRGRERRRRRLTRRSRARRRSALRD